MAKKKRNVAIGVGIAAGLGGLAYYLSKRGDVWKLPPDWETPNGDHDKLPDDKPIPDIDYPYLVEGRRCKLRIVAVSDPTFVGHVFNIEFYLVDDTKDLIVLTTPVKVTLEVILPDGSKVVETGQADGINIGLGHIGYRTTQTGTHYANFEGFKYNFLVSPNVTTSIFVPTGINLIWDHRPYSQELIDKGPNYMSTQARSNLINLVNNFRYEISAIDYKISRLLTDEPDTGRFDFKNNVLICEPDGVIRWQIRLVPSNLYLQGSLKDGGYDSRRGIIIPYDRKRYTHLWTYPDPDKETIISNRVSHYFWDNVTKKELGVPLIITPTNIEDTKTGTFRTIKTISEGWFGWPNRLATISEVARPGERYEVLVYVTAGVESYMSGYDHSIYAIRRYHVGYLIME